MLKSEARVLLPAPCKRQPRRVLTLQPAWSVSPPPPAPSGDTGLSRTGIAETYRIVVYTESRSCRTPSFRQGRWLPLIGP